MSSVKLIKPNINNRICYNNILILKNKNKSSLKCVICQKALRNVNKSGFCSNCRSKYKNKDWFIVYENKVKKMIINNI